MTQPTTPPLPPATPPTSPDRARATALLDARRAALAALPKTDIQRPRVSWEVVLELTAGLTRQFRAHVTGPGDLNEDAWKRTSADRDAIEADAITYFAAQDMIEAAQPSDRVARRRVLQREVRRHDAFLSRWGKPAFEDDAVEGPTVAAIAPGSGTADDAQDTVAWVAMWRRHPDVMAQSPVTRAYLDEAEANATELLPLLAEDERDDAARDLARRAFTAWARRFERLTKVGAFLGPDGLTWAGIAAPRGPATSKGEATEGGTTPPPAGPATPPPGPAPTA